MAKTYNRKEVQELLTALERSAGDTIMVAREASVGAEVGRYDTYARFREKCDDFNTLSILIEYRLKNIAGGQAKDLEDKFNELSAFMLSATLQTSLFFLRVLAETESLPLGSRDIFTGELRSLHSVREHIQSEKYANKLTDRTLADIKVAEDILEVIIDRAPGLLNLGLPQEP
jgi:hypothetical protein